MARNIFILFLLLCISNKGFSTIDSLKSKSFLLNKVLVFRVYTPDLLNSSSTKDVKSINIGFGSGVGTIIFKNKIIGLDLVGSYKYEFYNNFNREVNSQAIQLTPFIKWSFKHDLFLESRDGIGYNNSSIEINNEKFSSNYYVLSLGLGKTMNVKNISIEPVFFYSYYNYKASYTNINRKNNITLSLRIQLLTSKNNLNEN